MTHYYTTSEKKSSKPLLNHTYATFLLAT
uniref:Uncharacterized protein n=1 Tax=Arundo donax TaxID=35708 RepID=A0A0A9EC73_ARUDO